MKESVAKYLFYYPIQKLRGQSISPYIEPTEKAQYLSEKNLEEMREAKFKKLMSGVWQVPYYKSLFSEMGIGPADIQSLSDIQKIPVLDKRTILENEEWLIHPSYTKSALNLRKTGGSTGMTLHFCKESSALAVNDAIMYRCYNWYGIGVGDRQIRFWGVPVTNKLRWKEQLKDFVLNRIRVSAFEINEQECRRQYQRIQQFKPKYFYGYTTAIYGFCLFLKESGLDINALGLNAVICTAEKMYPHHRKLFDEVFDCPVVDEYGSCENGIIAFQCPHNQMHLMSDHMYIEFLDENDQPVEPGEQGRVVITDFSCHAMPLLRYDIGDVGRPKEGTCTCGVTLPLMDIVEGRKEDFIRTNDGKLVHAAYLCYTLKDDTVHEFKMYQKTFDSFLVQIVKSPSFSTDSEAMLKRKLAHSLGDNMNFDFQYLDSIPREKSGKLRYFVSEIEVE